MPTPLPNTNARWLNHTGTWNNPLNLFSPTVPFVMERSFTMASASGTIIPDFGFTADDGPVSIELEDPTGLIYPLTIPTTPPYFIGASVTSASPIIPVVGTWKVRARVLFIDYGNGFLVSGNILQIHCDTLECPIVCLSCPSDSVNLSTGINNAYNTLSDGAVDKHWNVTKIAGTTVAPIDPIVLTSASWSNPNPSKSRYIYYNLGGTGALEYELSRTFTVCDSGCFKINFRALADNNTSIYIDGTLISSTLNSPSGFLAANAATAVDYPIVLSVGVHTITAVVNNDGLQHGFWMNGSIKPDIGACAGKLIPDTCINIPLAAHNILLHAKLVNNNLAQLNWTAQSAEALHNYKVYKSLDNIDFEELATLDDEQAMHYNHQLAGIDCGHQVYYKISAETNLGLSIHSNTQSVQCLLNDQIVIFPNPAKEWIQIVTAHKFNKAELYNASGQLIQEWVYTNTNKYNLPKTVSGVYFVKIYTGASVFTQKLIIE
jgi:Secretion system C-terminal sorting domain